MDVFYDIKASRSNLYRRELIRDTVDTHWVVDRSVWYFLIVHQGSRFQYIWKHWVETLSISRNLNLLCSSSTNDVDFVTIKDCAVVISSWLKVIKAAPSCAVITRNCGNRGSLRIITSSKPSDDKCSFSCCYCWKITEAEAYLKKLWLKRLNLLSWYG